MWQPYICFILILYFLHNIHNTIKVNGFEKNFPTENKCPLYLFFILYCPSSLIFMLPLPYTFQATYLVWTPHQDFNTTSWWHGATMWTKSSASTFQKPNQLFGGCAYKLNLIISHLQWINKKCDPLNFFVFFIYILKTYIEFCCISLSRKIRERGLFWF